MKAYIQFKVLSTGYVPNTIPPQFKDELRSPIDELGSDGVSILDGRLSKDNMINEAFKRFSKRRIKPCIGFDVVLANTFSEQGKIIYSYITPESRAKISANIYQL